MPFCPKCRDEFQDWVKTCPDCRVRLVEKLRPESDPAPRWNRSHRTAESDRSKEPLALVASSSNEPEAKVWAGILEDSGIHCMVKPYAPGGYTSSRSPMASVIQPSSVLQFDVYVLESDVERAREILGRISDSDAETEADEDQPAGSTGSRDSFVALTAPQQEIEAKMLAETLENNGIRAVAELIPGYVKSGRYHNHQVHVRRSDMGRAKKIIRSISEPAAGAELSNHQPAKKRRLITSAVGIIDIVSGTICLSLVATFWATGALSDTDFSQTYALVAPIVLAVVGILAIPGGICVLRRRNRWIAVAGNVALALSIFPLGLLLLAPVVMYRDEFE